MAKYLFKFKKKIVLEHLAGNVVQIFLKKIMFHKENGSKLDNIL